MVTSPRTRHQRREDTLQRLEHDVDIRVATADAGGGTPHLVPLAFLWDGGAVLIAAPAASPTARNLRAVGKVRLGLGPTRDVVMIEGTARALAPSELTAALGDASASETGFDPRRLDDPYLHFRIEPLRLQAWREADELAGRELMRGGRWIALRHRLWCASTRQRSYFPRSLPHGYCHPTAAYNRTEGEG